MGPVQSYVISDLHLGHKAIVTYRPQFATAEAHDEAVLDGIADTVKKASDKLWILGDAAFTLEAVIALAKLPGRKFLVRGNHDFLKTRVLLAAFEEIYGAHYYKRPKRLPAWLTHIPVRADSLRGGVNIHGHTHGSRVPHPDRTHGPRGEDRSIPLWDERYINVCPEIIGYKPILLHPLIPKRPQVPEADADKTN